MKTRLNIFVRGSSHVASAVALRLFQAGHTVVIHDSLQPTTIRRRMSFTDAIFDGFASLEGVESYHAKDISSLKIQLSRRNIIPLATFEFSRLLEVYSPDVLVDARMRKRQQPELQRHLAPLTIGLGPNFTAGQNVHLAIETAWGERLGDIIKQGATRPLEGEPKPIDGHRRDRYVYAPADGIFHTLRNIGEIVSQGDEIAHVGDVPLYAPIGGTLRGLTRHGVPVAAKTKVIEVDPRIQNPKISGVDERPEKIAQGVLEAVSVHYAI